MIMSDSRLQDGILLVAGALSITALVMLRIGCLSAERSRIEQALRHEVTMKSDLTE